MADQLNIADLYVSGLSIPEIYNITGIALSTIRFRLKKLGILRTRSEAIKLASKNGKLGLGQKGKKRKFTEEWKNNISKGRKSYCEKHSKGVRLNSNGYYEYTRGEFKGKMVHIVLVEKHHRIKLNKNQVVHHKNHIKTDNRIENLKIMTRAEHASYHAFDNINKRNRDQLGRLI